MNFVKRFTLLLTILIYLLVQDAAARKESPDSAPKKNKKERKAEKNAPTAPETEFAVYEEQPEQQPDEPEVEPEPLDTANYPRMTFDKEPRQYIVGNIKVTGLKYLNPDVILSQTAIASGDTVLLPSDRLTIAAKRLWDQKFFSDIKVVSDFREDTVDLNFILQERLRVSTWQFGDLKKGDVKSLNEKMKLRRNSEYSEYLMATNLRLIREFYDEKAFRNAKIDYTVDPDSLKEGNVIVTFLIDRGRKVRIKEFMFEGNDNISGKNLAKSFKKTHKVGINFFKNFRYKEENFEEDRENLLGFYRSEGYRYAQILDDSIYNINPKRIGIWINVQEGKKYYLRNVSWIGNTEIETRMLESMVPMKRGEVYDSETLGVQLGTIVKGMNDPSIKNWYSDQGYLAIEVYPAETVEGDSVDLEIRIVEGKKFTIKDVNIEGNTRTNDHVIRRELYTHPGDLYDRSLLMMTYSRLSSMEQFEPSSTVPRLNPNMQQNTVDITYELVEVPNDQVQISGGWGGGMFIASVGLRFTNVSLRRLFDKDGWRPYPAGDNQILDLNVQTNGSYYSAASIGFTEPWLGGRKPISLSLSLYTSRETDAYWYGQRPSRYFGTIGGSVGIGKRLNWPDNYFNLSYGLQLQTYNIKDWYSFIITNGSSNIFAMNLGLSRNSVDDNFQYATTGSNISLGVSFTPPYSWFNGVDYSQDMTNQERFRWIEYHKWRFDAEWYFPLDRNNKLVLMTRGKYGYLGYYNRYRKSPFEGFQMGGDGLSGFSLYGVETVGMRGYSNSELTPYANYGLYASIFSKYTAELRYPLAQRGGMMVYMLGFLEAGNAFRELNEFKPFDLKRSAGVGLRLYMPILGQIGVDWGYGFDQTSSSRGKPAGSNFHFTMGRQF